MAGKRAGVIVNDDSFMALGTCWRKRRGVDGVERPLIPPAWFFADDGRKLADKMKVVNARVACSICPVRAECLEFALAGRIEHGVWGGTIPEEREVLLSRRRGNRVPRRTLVSV